MLPLSAIRYPTNAAPGGQVLLDATKPQDGLNGDAHGEGGDSGRATGSEVGWSKSRQAVSKGIVESRHITNLL